MKHIAYYISDHGFGHAARSIAIIRELSNNSSDITIHVCCDFPLDFIKSSIHQHKDNVLYHRVRNDVGYVTDENLCVDKNRTKVLVENWLKTWDVHLKNEIRFCKENNIDGIISDIAPQPFLIGKRLGLPSIGISNFTWTEIYEDMGLPKYCIEKITNAYHSALLGVVLPLDTHNLPFTNQRRIGWIYRSKTMEKEKLRSQLEIDPLKKIIYVSLGYSPIQESQQNVIIPKHVFDDFFIIVSSNNTLIANPSFRLGSDETESQNYISAADIVISKFGYSTISEAIAYNVPMLLLKRNIIEDEEGIKPLLNKGLAEEITLTDLFDGSWIEHMSRLLERKPFSKKIDDQFQMNGIKDMLDIVKNNIL